MSFKEAATDFIRSEITKGGNRVWDGGKVRELTEDDRIEVLRFDFNYDHGYTYSSWTYEDASFTVSVRYRLNDEGGERTVLLYNEDTYTMGDFLNRLLDHEDSK